MTAERQARLYRDGDVVRLRHMPTQLREVSSVRTVGYQDAVADLGTHPYCGHMVPYSKAQVYAVLQGRNRSERLLRRIWEKRPELLRLRFVAPEVRAWAERMGAGAESPRAERGAAKLEGAEGGAE